MTQQTIAEFLLSRIAEDMTEVTRLADQYPSLANEDGWIANGDDVSIAVGLRRASAECEAKRRIVEFLRPTPDMPEGEGRFVATVTLHLMALPYVDHPDYRTERRP